MIDKLLNNLTKVKRTGQDSWLACCSAHEDKSPSLAIKQTADGMILLKCFAGCSVEEVLGAIGLTFDDLYPEKPYTEHARKPDRMPFNPRDVLAAVSKESMIVALVADKVSRGKAITEKDRDRVTLAMSRLQTAAEICHADE